MFEFTGLRILHNDMIKNGEKRATFSFEYNEKSFSCIFLTDVNPFRLYLTTLGSQLSVFVLEIERGYKTRCFIDNYNELVNFLEIKYNSMHKFSPVDFFKALNKGIPEKFTSRPVYFEVLKIDSKIRTIEEKEKIYFCGWRKNALGQNVSWQNFEKTRSAFGDEIAQMSKEKNVSSCWTACTNEEELKKLNDIITM